MPASTRCSAGRSVTLLLFGRASRLEPGGRRLGESGEEALRWLKSALWMAARGEVGDVEDAGSDTLPGNGPRLGPGASSQLVRPGLLTVSPSSKPVTQWGRRGRRRGPGPRRVPSALAKPRRVSDGEWGPRRGFLYARTVCRCGHAPSLAGGAWPAGRCLPRSPDGAVGAGPARGPLLPLPPRF